MYPERIGAQIISDAGLGLTRTVAAEYPTVLRRASVKFLWSW